LGLRRDIRVLDHEATFSAHGDRHKVPARGMAGGLAGGCGAYVVNPGEAQEERLPPKVSGIRLAPGSVLRTATPGGGGYGPPGDRDKAKVGADLRAGILSRRAAEEAYGMRERSGGARKGGERVGEERTLE